MAERAISNASASPFSVAYVMTHYPRVALTFISGEIDEIERCGGRIFPIAMNLPSAADVATDAARERQRQTLYLKSNPSGIAAAILGAAARHPLKISKLAARAVTSARSDLGLAARRLIHVAYAAVVARHCRANGVRHLHAQFGLAPATIAWFACEMLNFDAGATCTWSFTIHGFQDFINEAEARLDLKAASASSVICVSDFTRSQLCRVTDFNYWQRFHVMRCGIDLGAFPFRQVRPMRPIPRIVILGRLSPEKGHGILLEAVRTLTQDDVPVEVHVIGDGPFRDAIRLQARGLGIEDRVSLLGEMEPGEVSRGLADADIFCMASFSEGLPISIMEAMAIGVPVITTWISGIPELAVQGETALTVPPGNSDALAAAIKRLIADRSLCDRLVVAARAAVERSHSRETNAKQLAGMFRSLIEPTVTE